MSRLIVHIGTHKTATSALQQVFFSKRHHLEKHSIFYPVAGWGTAQHSLPAHWVNLPEQYQIPGGLEAWRKALANIATRDCTVLLSSEELSRGAPTRVDMSELAGIFTGFDEVELWCTLRNQASFIQAVYLQIIRQRTGVELAPFVKNCLQQRLCDGLYLNYLDLHQHLTSAFPAEAIRYVSFEQACQQPGGIIAHYLNRLRPGLYEEMNLSTEEHYSNLSPPALPALLASGTGQAHSLERKKIQVARTLVEEKLGLQAKTSIFTRQEAEQIQQLFEPLNHEFEAQLSQQGFDLQIGSLQPSNSTVYRDEVDLEELYRNLASA